MISFRIPKHLADFVDARVETLKAQGKRWDRTKEITAAIQQRQLSFLPKVEREKVLKLLGIRCKKAELKPVQGDLLAGEGGA